jgi:hypothetical protein
MDLFERLDKGRPPPAEDQPNEIVPAQKLLDFLQHWAKPTVCRRDILMYGPHSIRNRKSVISTTQTLVDHGWLIPNKTRRRDAKEWLIVRKPIVRPTVAAK